MGNSQSTPQPAAPKGPPPRPNAQPTARPLSTLGPQGPSYANPENKVLPFVLPPAAKSMLKPVSQELSEYNPDYKEIFSSETLDNEKKGENGNVTNGDRDLQDMNGNVSSPQTSNGHISGMEIRNRPVTMYGSSSNVSVKPSNGSIKSHRRQLSASSALYSRENTILEHPDEPKYSTDFRNPEKVPLPAKNTFDMPYTEQLTYAQLAEYRRNQTLADLEKKTGKKIENLNDYAQKPSASNLERTPSTKSSKSEKSAGSALGKKKSRAPQPPGPPPPNPPGSKSAPSTPRGTNMHTPPARPNKPPPILKSYSVDKEPPADYDDVLPKRNVSINRSASSVSGQRKSLAPLQGAPNAPPPPPPPVSGILRNASDRNNTPKSNLPRSSSTSDLIKIRSPPVLHDNYNKPKQDTEQNKFLSEIQRAAERRSMRRQVSEPNVTIPPPVEFQNKPSKHLVYNAEESNTVNSQSEITNTDTDTIPLPPKVPPPVAVKPIRTTSTSSFERQSSITSETSLSNSVQSSNSSEQNGAIRRLNSLLQHDIKLAAQAKATKIVKHATQVKEKPKDPAQVFREQLAKAAYERDSRAKTGPSIDDQLKAAQAKEKEEKEANIVFYTEQVTVKRSDSLHKQNGQLQRQTSENTRQKEELQRQKSESTSNLETIDKQSKKQTPKEVITIQRDEIPPPQNSGTVAMPGEYVRHPRQMTPDGVDLGKDNYHKSIYASNDWTPGDDLGSEDDISDNEVMTSSLSKSNGFKSSIVPSKVNEMNYKGKKQKGKERKFKKNVDSDDKKKHGSIKKFKQSVHKSVLNAFGSISKASGKVLKKNKSEDFEQSDEAPKNWQLSSSSSTPSFSGTPVASRPTLSEGSLSGRAYKYMVPNGYQDHMSSSECSDEEKNNVFNNNGHVESNEDSENEIDQQYLKRAGVAYVSKSGQIVVLPEYDKVKPGERPGEFDNRAPKIKTKKKKFAYDATVRKKEREQLNEQISADQVEKEKRREEERQRELEADMEVKHTREQEARSRELDANERLQRLQMQAQLQQRMLQQQQQYGIQNVLSAPPLPPPNGFQQGYNPMEYSQFLPQQPGFGMHYGPQTGFGTPNFNASMPNMSTYDLSEYMRMMGVQNNQPSTSSQQLNAYMLAGLNWPQASLLNYQTKLTQDDSKNNQVYQTWTGPTKIVKSKDTSDGGAVYSVTNSSRKPSGSQYSADESDSSAGLSPQRTDASLSASRNKLNENDKYGYKSQISVTTVYTPGFNKSADSGNVASTKM